ncbi:MAG: ATP-dependent RecD-like DNA helicase [Prochloraceae cyanobacterium]
MPRGGKREGAGRKPSWYHQPTKNVKIPEPLIEYVLDYAKTIDRTKLIEKLDDDDHLVREKLKEFLTVFADILKNPNQSSSEDELIDGGKANRYKTYQELNEILHFARLLKDQKIKNTGDLLNIADRYADEYFATYQPDKFKKIKELRETTGEKYPQQTDVSLPLSPRHLQIQTPSIEAKTKNDGQQQQIAPDSDFNRIREKIAADLKHFEKEREEIKLTESQSTALKLMQQFITSNKKSFRLSGYSGTGKSFLTCFLLKWLHEKKISFVAGSPTNEAVKNLKNLAANFGLKDLAANTVAQLLGQQPVLNKNTGVEEFVSRQLKPSIADYDIVAIDEYSMLNSKDFQEIVKELSSSKTKIIFIGDPAQLPPVGEDEPIVATSNAIEDRYSLTEVVRYEGEIARVAEEIRSDFKYNRTVYPFETTADRSIICLPRDEWREVAADFFKSEQYRANPNYVRFLVWRNRTAADLNTYIRSELWGEDCPPYVIGDRLIARIPVFRPVAGGKGKNKWAIAMNNSEKCEVIGQYQLEKFSLKRYGTWQYYLVPVRTERCINLDLRILTPEFELKRAETLDKLRKAKRWNDYTTILKSFDNVPFSYATTTHKAQGSTIDRVFLDLRDMARCPNLQKIIYTALTRSRVAAYVN